MNTKIESALPNVKATKTNLHSVDFPHGVKVMAGTLSDVTHLIWNYLADYEDEGAQEPTTITLPTGHVIKWDFYIFNACYSKGRITETELIEGLLIEEVIHA